MARFNTIPFVDRIEIRNDIKNFISESEGLKENSGVLIYAQSGVGKSRFVDELFGDREIKGIKIKVAMHRINGDETPDGFYFDALYHAIFDQAKFGFLKKIGLLKIGFSLSYIVGLSFERGNDYYFDNSTIKKYNQVKKYVENSKARLIIGIENFHSIDAVSYDLLCKLLKSTGGNYYIFEYTSPSEHDEGHLGVLSEFEKLKASVKSQKLEPLDEDSLLDLKKVLWAEDASFRKFKMVYEDNCGNLIPLVLNNGQPRESEVTTVKTLVKNLTESQQLILFLIAFNQQAMKKRHLKKLLDSFQREVKYIDTREALERTVPFLLQNGYLTERKKGFDIAHDSIIVAVEQLCNTPMAHIAFGIVSRFYEQSLNSKSKARQANSVVHLSYLYVLFQSKNISRLLPFFRVFFQQKDQIGILIDRTIHLLNRLESTTKSRFVISIKQELFVIAFDAGKHDCLKYLLESYNETEEKEHLIAYIAAHCVLLDKPSIEFFAAQAIKKYPDDLRFSLIVKMHIFSYYLRVKPSCEAKEYVRCIFEEQKYARYLEYYSILKVHSELLGNDEAIENLQLCVKEFRKNGRPDLAARSLVTLGSRYANKGNLMKAKSALRIVATFYRKDYIKPYYLLSNLAVIEILQDRESKKTEKKLLKSKVYPSSQYELALILSNLLIYYSKSKNYQHAHEVFNELNSLDTDQYAYENFHHILLTNIHYYYTQFPMLENNADVILETERRIYQIASQENIDPDLKELILCKKSGACLPSTNRYKTYESLPYRPGYVGYWQMEIGNT